MGKIEKNSKSKKFQINLKSKSICNQNIQNRKKIKIEKSHIEKIQNQFEIEKNQNRKKIKIEKNIKIERNSKSKKIQNRKKFKIEKIQNRKKFKIEKIRNRKKFINYRSKKFEINSKSIKFK